MEDKFVLVACEESQRVCAEFRKLGFIAFSCDIKPESGGHPEWHIQGDVLDVLYPPLYFKTMDCMVHRVPKWDLIIAHPPCTRLCNSGQRWRFWGSDEQRKRKERETVDAIKFFMTFAMLTNCDHIAIENPVGIMSNIYRKPDCIYNPYDFAGETDCKKLVCGCEDCRRLNQRNHSHRNNEHKTYGKHISMANRIPGIHPKQLGYGVKHLLV